MTMTKICIRCKLPRWIGDFAKRGEKRIAQCKLCKRKVWLRWYKANHARHVAYNKITQNAIKLRNKTFIAEYLKDKSCLDCGNKDTVVLHFHHRDPKNKFSEVSTMSHRGYSLENIVKEINKCDVLCSNCHIKRHNTEH